MGRPLTDFLADIVKQYLHEMEMRRRTLEVVMKFYEHHWGAKVRLHEIMGDVCSHTNVVWSKFQGDKIRNALALLPNELQVRDCFVDGNTMYWIRNLRRKPEAPARAFTVHGKPTTKQTRKNA